MSRNDFRHVIPVEDGGTIQVRRVPVNGHPDAYYLSVVDRFGDVVTVRLTVTEVRDTSQALDDADLTADLDGAA